MLLLLIPEVVRWVLNFVSLLCLPKGLQLQCEEWHQSGFGGSVGMWQINGAAIGSALL